MNQVTDMTLEQRFDRAVKEIRKNGVRVRRNTARLFFPWDAQPMIWHDGTNNHAFDFDGDRAWYRRWNRGHNTYVVDHIYLNHHGLHVDGVMNDLGRMVLEVFAKHGFGVVWDGTYERAIKIIFERVFDCPMGFRF